MCCKTARQYIVEAKVIINYFVIGWHKNILECFAPAVTVRGIGKVLNVFKADGLQKTGKYDTVLFMYREL